MLRFGEGRHMGQSREKEKKARRKQQTGLRQGGERTSGGGAEKTREDWLDPPGPHARGLCLTHTRALCLTYPRGLCLAPGASASHPALCRPPHCTSEPAPASPADPGRGGEAAPDLHGRHLPVHAGPAGGGLPRPREDRHPQELHPRLGHRGGCTGRGEGPSGCRGQAAGSAAPPRPSFPG